MVGKVSVLIPTFNRARYIGECIDSVLGQTLPPHQVIVIDDGSNDGTSAVLQLYGARITVLRKSNGGKSSALNLGMKHVTGDFVWIFDDDDVALPNSIELRLETLRGRPELGFIFSAHYYGRNAADGNIQRGARYNMRARPEPDIFGELMSGFFFTLNSLLARTECYRAVGDFDETLLRSQDYDMMIRLARRFACAGLNEPTYILRRHTGERGPGQLRHSGLSRESIWVKYDQQIGRRIREQFALEEFLPGLQNITADPFSRRKALLRRMVVMASKGLISEMLDDLEMAMVDQDLGGLTVEERNIVRGAIYHFYFGMELPAKKQEFIRRLRGVAMTHAGRGAIASFARSFLWLASSTEGSLGLRASRLLMCVRLALLSLPFPR